MEASSPAHLAELTRGWACPVCVHVQTPARPGGRGAEGHKAHEAHHPEPIKVLLCSWKETKVASCWAKPSKPQYPNSKNRIERPTSEQTQEWRKTVKKSFGSEKQILGFDFSCLLFGFPLEQRCVRHPWLASWQGSLQYASFTF